MIIKEEDIDQYLGKIFSYGNEYTALLSKTKDGSYVLIYIYGHGSWKNYSHIGKASIINELSNSYNLLGDIDELDIESFIQEKRCK